jgi:hypothetical protein
MHTPNLSMRLQLQRDLLCCKVRCRRATPLIFWKAELADRKAECCFLACAWQSTPQLPSRANSCVVGADEGNRLRKPCTVSVPWSCQADATFSIVVSDPRSHHRRWGLDPTACHRLRRSPKSSRSTAHANVACARWLQGRKGALEAARQVPRGFSAADAWKMVSRYTWGSCDRATRGHFCLSPPAGSFAYAFADRRLLCSKDWFSQPRFGAVLDGGFAGRASNTLTGRPQPHTGSTTAKSGRNVCLGERRPRPGEGTVG